MSNFFVDKTGRPLPEQLVEEVLAQDTPAVETIESKSIYDAWAEDVTPKDKIFVDPENGFEVLIDRKRNGRSNSSRITVADTKGVVRGTVPCHPGISYNSREEDRVNAVEAALKIAEEHQKHDDEWRALKNAAVYKHRRATGEGAEEEEEEETSSDIPEHISKPVKAEDRKTTVQRNKKQKVKAQESESAQRQFEKEQAQDLKRIPRLLKEIEQSSKKRPAPAKDEPKPFDPSLRLGPHKYSQIIPEVVYSEDVPSESPMRLMKVKDSLLHDHMNNLERQGKIETRKKRRRTHERAIKLYNIWT